MCPRRFDPPAGRRKPNPRWGRVASGRGVAVPGRVQRQPVSGQPGPRSVPTRPGAGQSRPRSVPPRSRSLRADTGCVLTDAKVCADRLKACAAPPKLPARRTQGLCRRGQGLCRRGQGLCRRGQGRCRRAQDLCNPASRPLKSSPDESITQVIGLNPFSPIRCPHGIDPPIRGGNLPLGSSERLLMSAAMIQPDSKPAGSRLNRVHLDMVLVRAARGAVPVASRATSGDGNSGSSAVLAIFVPPSLHPRAGTPPRDTLLTNNSIELRQLTAIELRRKLRRMTPSSEGFADWAGDPCRTLEERFGAELLIEHTLGLWRNKHGIKVRRSAESPLRCKDAKRGVGSRKALYGRHSPAVTDGD